MWSQTLAETLRRIFKGYPSGQLLDLLSLLHNMNKIYHRLYGYYYYLCYCFSFWDMETVHFSKDHRLFDTAHSQVLRSIAKGPQLLGEGNNYMHLHFLATHTPLSHLQIYPLVLFLPSNGKVCPVQQEKLSTWAMFGTWRLFELRVSGTLGKEALLGARTCGCSLAGALSKEKAGAQAGRAGMRG